MARYFDDHRERWYSLSTIFDVVAYFALATDEDRKSHDIATYWHTLSRETRDPLKAKIIEALDTYFKSQGKF